MTDRDPSPRLALVGLGAAARNIHIPAFRLLGERVRLVAGCDADPVARASAPGLPTTYETLDEMLDRESPDMVAICTPPHVHVEQTLAALDAGCHVFCEKPFAESLEDADRVIAASETAGRSVVVNSEFPAMRIHRAAKERIGSEEFGRLLYLHASQTFRTTEETEAGWRGSMRRRLCFEFGVHVFELVRFFFDAMPVTLMCHMPSPPGRGGPEPVNVVAMGFADGRAASVVLDRLSRGPERYLDIRLDGERATIQTSIGGELGLSVGLHTRERRPYVRLGVAGGGTALLQDGTRSTVIARDGMNPFAAATAVHLGRFLDCLRDGGEPPASARDHRNTLALVLAAYDAAETGASVDLARYVTERARPA